MVHDSDTVAGRGGLHHTGRDAGGAGLQPREKAQRRGGCLYSAESVLSDQKANSDIGNSQLNVLQQGYPGESS